MAQTNDTFLAIAVNPVRSQRPALPELPPRAQPPRPRLEGTGAAATVPPAAKRLRDQADVERALADLRAAHAPFLRELAPAAPPRPRQPIDTFAMRFAEPADCSDPLRAGRGEGTWETVRVPHYRGPVGRWTRLYRAVIRPDASLWRDGRVWLVLRGVDYACRVFLDHGLVGTHTGFFDEFAFDVTDRLRAGDEHVLLIEVDNDHPMQGNGGGGEKIYAATGLGWDEPGSGWHHCPPGGGVWQPVFLESRAPACITDLFVRPQPDHEQAEVWIEAHGSALAEVAVAAEITILPRNHEDPAFPAVRVELGPLGPGHNEYRVSLHLPHFRWWSPEAPWLYLARVALIAADGTRDEREVSFGMRTFAIDEHGERKGTLRLNGERIVLRGANTMGHEQRCIAEGDEERLVGDILLSKAAHMNFWRLTQRPVQREVYDWCDRLGLMTQTDLPLFGKVRRHLTAEVARQAGVMERFVRRHPCNIVVSFINEPFPDAWHQGQRHRLIDRDELEAMLECCTAQVRLHNPDRAVKPIDGDYDPPNRHGMPDHHIYCGWYFNHGMPIGKLHAGWMFGMKPGWRGGCGEYGSEGLDHWETMAAHYPKEWLPAGGPDAEWTPAPIAQNQTEAIHRIWFDRQTSARAWIAASQRHQAWATRIMTDAFRMRADCFVSTAIHLGIDAYPAGWMKAVVDVTRRPKAAYYELADSQTPLAVNVRTQRPVVWGGEAIDAAVWIFNDRERVPPGCRLVAWVREGDVVRFSRELPARITPVDAELNATIAWTTPPATERTTYTVGASLVAADGAVLHDHAVAVTAFPPPVAVLAGRSVGVIGAADGAAWKLAALLGAQPTAYVPGAAVDLVLADDVVALGALEGALAADLEAGGRLLVLEQGEPRPWRLAGRTVPMIATDGFHFASHRLGHPAAAALLDDDTRCWFDEALGYQGHVVHHVFDTAHPDLADAERIVNGPVAGWGMPGVDRGGVVARRIGAGIAMLSQLRLGRCAAREPRARFVAEQLIGWLLR